MLLLICTISFSLEQIVKNQEVLVILYILVLLTFVVGLVGYQVNFIQLGLDQLFEAQNQYQGLFIHHATWAFNSGLIPLSIFMPLFACSQV